jgi:hypothetical protein
LKVGIGGQEDVAGREPVEQFVVLEETVLPQDCIGDAKMPGPLHQHVAIALAVAGKQVGVRRADDPVHDIGVMQQNAGQRVDDMLQPLAGAQKTEGGEHHPPLQPLRGLCRRAGGEGAIRRAVLDHVDQIGPGVVTLDEQFARMAAHHHDAAGARQQMVQDRPLTVRRLGKNGMERQHQRRGQAIDEIANQFAVSSAENAVFVLKPDGFRAAGVDRTGGCAKGHRIARVEFCDIGAVIAVARAIVERADAELYLRMIAGDLLGKIARKGGDTALAWGESADERNARALDRLGTRGRLRRLPRRVAGVVKPKNGGVQIHRQPIPER